MSRTHLMPRPSQLGTMHRCHPCHQLLSHHMEFVFRSMLCSWTVQTADTSAKAKPVRPPAPTNQPQGLSVNCGCSHILVPSVKASSPPHRRAPAPPPPVDRRPSAAVISNTLKGLLNLTCAQPHGFQSPGWSPGQAFPTCQPIFLVSC